MHVLAQIPTEKRPRAIFLASQSHRGYVTDEFGAALTVFSTDDYQVVQTIALGDPKLVRPMGIASPDGGSSSQDHRGCRKASLGRGVEPRW